MRKSILFFSRFNASANGGGGAHREAQLAELLLPLGCRYLSCWDSNHMKNRIPIKAKIISRIQRRFSPYKKFWIDEDTWEYAFDLRAVSREWQRELRKIRKIDLVVLDDPLYFQPVAEYAHKKRIPLVGLCQNLESLSPSQLNRKHQLELFHNEIMLLKKCALVVTISREETLLLQNLHVPAFYLPYEPVTSIRERLMKVKERRSRGRKQGYLALGTVGNKATLAGMKALIEHWGSEKNKLHDEKLFVAGFWTPTYLKAAPFENTAFMGELANEKLDDLLSTVKATICYQEFGSGALTKIKEMLLAGVPVLANAHAFRSYHEFLGAGVLEFTGLDALDKAAAMIGAMSVPGLPGETAVPAPAMSLAVSISRVERELLRRVSALLASR